MMHADPPTFVVDGTQAVSHVPAILTNSRVGDVGVAGTVDVNVRTGQMDSSEDQIEQIYALCIRNGKTSTALSATDNCA